MWTPLKIIAGAALSMLALSTLMIIAANAQEVRTGETVICQTLGDARAYAATHRDKIQAAIDSETHAKACLVAKVAFVPGKEADRMEQKDATYTVTEILVVAVSTPYGLLSIYPSQAYTLLKIDEKTAAGSRSSVAARSTKTATCEFVSCR